MSNELSTQNKGLTTNNDLPEEVKKLMAKEGINVSVGDIFISSSSYETIIRISKIEAYKGSLHISSEKPKDWDATEWVDYSRIEASYFKGDSRYQKLLKPYSEYRAEADAVINGKISIEELSIKDNQSDENNTSLISKSSKEGLIAIQNDMELKKRRVEMIRAFVGLEMEKRKQELDKIKDQLKGVLTVFEKQIKRIMRVITTIELYLGIDEEIVQIQEGEKAPIDTPITFRQRVLYMDEEIANTDDGGFDFRDVHKFDAWLMDNKHYKNLLPEIKGVLVFRPRRNDKHYSDNYFENKEINLNNKETYLLIRNGDCLYRIYSDKIKISPRLFPQRTELMDLLKKVEEIQESPEKVEDLMYQYKKRAVLLQGLIDRTEILHPMPPNLSIFKMDEAGDMFNFIYDDEAALPDGRLPFWDWVKENNEKIGHGSRIVLTGDYSSYSRNDSGFLNRIFKYVNEHNAPPLPNRGVYEIDEYTETATSKIFTPQLDSYKEKHPDLIVLKEYTNRVGTSTSEIKYNLGTWLTIKHNPKDEVYSGWGGCNGSSERKNKIRWKIYKKDKFVLNYDQISLDDINFYLQNRSDRENYLEMMPLLRTLKQWRLKELESEKYFADMVMQQINSTTLKKPIVDLWSKIWEAIEWWKFKNMIKRPIDKDDSKALRMIMKKLISDNK